MPACSPLLWAILREAMRGAVVAQLRAWILDNGRRDADEDRALWP